MWISCIVLASCCLVITQSLPHPGYNIPAVPFGVRAQYYVLHDDGNYKYGYDSGAGQFETAVKMGDAVTGTFGFTDAAGEDIRVQYTSDGEGFKPTLHSAPVPVPKAAPLPVSTDVAASPAEAAPAPAPQEYAPNTDASYSFNYKTDTSAREETADPDLNVVGSFSFVADDGIHRAVNYIAGSDTGFVATGNHLPVAPDADAPAPAVAPVAAPVPKSYQAEPVLYNSIDYVPEFTLNADGSYDFKYANPHSTRSETADSDLNVKGVYTFVGADGVERKVNYVAGSTTGFVTDGDHPATAPVAAAPAAPQPAAAAVSYSAPAAAHESSASTDADASYNFSYKNSDSSRDETADSDLNVKGSFGFTADDGKYRQVNYIAGSATGFVAEGDHLPVAPEVPAAYSAAVASAASSVPEAPAAPSTLYSAPDASSSGTDASESTSDVDGSYSFSYETDHSHRDETADSDLNVKGSFGFKAGDGIYRRVNYIAGSNTGFVAEGDHLPVAPEIPDVYSAPAAPAAPAVAAAPAPETYSADSDSGIDGSYSFNYKTDHSHRDETADSDLNVKGSFGFKADDGVYRRVNYFAGSGTGFVAEGDHLPVAPEAPAVYAAPVVPVAPAAPVVPTPAVVYSAPETYSSDSDSGVDGSYSFNYKTSDSHREETADADLNVKGSFGFQADDGIYRHVNYIAGSDTGFVAEGDHLPVAPATPDVYAAPAPAPAAPVAPSPASAAPAPAVASEYSADSDGSYSFKYETSDSHRDETADSDLNVKGSFGFTADDGRYRKVNYIAGSETGFVAEGDHLPVAPEVPAVPAAPAPAPVAANVYTAPAPAPAPVKTYQYSAPATPVNLYTAPAPAPAPEVPSTLYSAPTISAAPAAPAAPAVPTPLSASAGAADGHLETVVGNVLLRQYITAPGRTKFGYVFTEQ